MTEYSIETILVISFFSILLFPIVFLYEGSRQREKERLLEKKFRARLVKKSDIFRRSTEVKKRKIGPVLKTQADQYLLNVQEIKQLKAELALHERNLDHEAYNRCARDFIESVTFNRINPVKFPDNTLSSEELYFPLLESKVGEVNVRGKIVNVGKRKCTCSWLQYLEETSNLNEIPLSDIRRVCRHQAEIISRHWDIETIPATELAKAIFRHIYRKEFYAEFVSERPFRVLIGFEKNSSWIDVYLNKYDESNKFGFDFSKRTWAGGKRPTPFAVEIKQIISDAFGSII